MRIIYFSMALLVFSFIAMPIYYGISEKHNEIINTEVTAIQDDSLSFEEIYSLADESYSTDPAFLNTIKPAAGNSAKNDQFSTGFRRKEDSALADTPVKIIEEVEEEQASF